MKLKYLGAIAAAAFIVVIAFQQCARAKYGFPEGPNALQSAGEMFCHDGVTEPCPTEIGTGIRCRYGNSELPNVCLFESCNPPFELHNHQCVMPSCGPGSFIYCPVDHGAGRMECEAAGTYSTECVAFICIPGYTVNNGECTP